MAAAVTGADERAKLVGLLQTAAQVEHSLMLAYLYAGCSLRSTPQEFATLANGHPNPRRAVQFELARTWKQKIMNTAVEEMLHLHYVQCLLRAMGQSPYFTLPGRENGSFVIPPWLPLDPNTPSVVHPAHISLAPIDKGQLDQFVIYEATDALQQADARGPVIQKLFMDLCRCEYDLRNETMLLNVPDDTRSGLKQKLAGFYAPAPFILVDPKVPPPPADTFPSINDLYRNGIQPLYEKGFAEGWITHSNLMLNNELFDPNVAGNSGGRMVPVGPVQRSNRFGRLIQKTADDPMRNFKDLRDIIDVILGEGEGFVDFQQRAQALLTAFQSEGGTRKYALGLAPAIFSAGMNTPPWMSDFEMVRQSHLYRFAMVQQSLLEEGRCSFPEAFDPNRQRLPADSNPQFARLASELTEQVNACYLVLIAWMSRIYEIPNWAADQARRNAIEMLAAWPLMSRALRPLLELASFFDCDVQRLFQNDAQVWSTSPAAARLASLYSMPDRAEVDNAAMDEAAVLVLANTADWARNQMKAVAGASIPEHARQMVLNRLRMLSQLDEFQKQFAYRVAGGYSDRLPSLDYQQQFPDGARFEEDPFAHKPTSQKPQQAVIDFPVFSNTLLLRLRFKGWALAQLANDPDPAEDEVGCQGTTMLHPADGNRSFDTAIVWQPNDPASNILREPREKLPPIGVDCCDVALLLANGDAQVGYVPLPTKQLPGSLQNVPVQEELGISGLLPILSLTTEELLGPGRKIRVDLKDKNGAKPFYNGLNHLVWQDGEPIDPFVLSMTSDPPLPVKVQVPPPGAAPPPGLRSLILQREVYNRDLSLLEMTPLQRLLSSRGPCGFMTGTSSFPEWAISPADRKALQNPKSYLAARADVLADSLQAALAAGGDPQTHSDEVVSLAERMALVNTPRGTYVNWLSFALHWGHTLSGPVTLGDGLDEILSTFGLKTGLQLAVPYSGARYQTNSRWLVKYTCGAMDSDALSNVVYGELYLPVTVMQVAGPMLFSKSWTFPATLHPAVTAFACQFASPFWGSYRVNGNTRTLQGQNQSIMETLQGAQGDQGYTYTIDGLAGVSASQCSLSVVPVATETTLTWSVSLTCSDPVSAFNALAFAAQGEEEMSAALVEHFRPKS